MDRHQVEGRVAFVDTDLAGIVHHANYFRYMEAAEHDFWRSCAGSALPLCQGKRYGWPRVHVSCDYRAPLRFEDTYRIRLFITNVGTKSLHFLHVVTRLSGSEEAVVAIGRVATVCMDIDSPDGLHAVAIPEALITLLEPAPPGDYECFL